MADRSEDRRGSRDTRRGVAALTVAVAVVVFAMTAGVTSGPSPATGATAWLVEHRPAGAVVTVTGWGSTLRADGRFTVDTADRDEIVDRAARLDPGSVVLPVGSTAIDDLETTGRWTLSYRDDDAAVLVQDGALPVVGAT